MLPIPGAGDAWNGAVWDALANGANSANSANGANGALPRALPRVLPPKELLLKARVTAAAVGEAVSATYHHAVADGIIRRGRSPIGEPGRPPGRACEKTNLVGQRFANRVELLVRNVGAMVDRKWPDTGCLMPRNPTPLETFHLQDREPIHGYHLLSDFPFLTFEFSTH